MKWEEPRPSQRNPRGGKWRAIATELINNPMRWAKIYERAENSSSGHNFFLQQYAQERGVVGKFKSANRSNHDGTYSVYLRWVPEGMEDEG
jgi:hypothetical protein